MDVSRRREGTRSSVVAGSVLESRMKVDEVKCGVKVVNGEEVSGESGTPKVKRSLSVCGVSGKRKHCKSESSEGFDKNPNQILRGKELSVSVDGIKKNPIRVAKGKSESNKNVDENVKELSVSVDGVKKSPIQRRKLRSEGSKEECVLSPTGTRKQRSELVKESGELGKEIGESREGNERSPIGTRKQRSESMKESGEMGKQVPESGEGIERSPIGTRKQRSESMKESGEMGKEVPESGEGIEKNSIQLRKVKSETVKVLEQSSKSGTEIEKNSVQLRKTKSEPNRALDESGKVNDVNVEEIEKNPVEEIEETGSDETCKEFGVCQEKAISSIASNVGQPLSDPNVLVDDEDDGVDVEGDEEYFEDEEEEEEGDEEIEIEIEKKSFDIKEINIPEQKPKKVVIEDKFHQFHQRSAQISPTVNKQPPPVTKQPKIYTKYTPRPVSDGYQNFPETQSKLQSLVDLVMWRDVSRSTFVFGIGTFITVSSSYTQDLNISFISVISYLGLVYLAAIFLFRSIICRGIIDTDNTSYVIGKEEAIWLMELILPYLNEFLLKLRALFSGDPATTMKMAVLLFVLARCGSSITIWKMLKLGFFAVFTVPKVCSSYSTQLTAYGKFWVRRFRDAWDSCSHKKAVAFAIFTLVWNLSSIVARIWAVFMMFVGVRYYQQSVARDEWVDEDDDTVGEEDSWQEQVEGQRPGLAPSFVGLNKLKKGS